MIETDFEWNEAKNLENQVRHIISFQEARKSMKKQIQYNDEQLGKLELVPDFLPSPGELALKEENVKITIALSKESVEFFKAEAKRHQIKYQRMIRQLLDLYVSQQKQQEKPGALNQASAGLPNQINDK